MARPTRSWPGNVLPVWIIFGAGGRQPQSITRCGPSDKFRTGIYQITALVTEAEILARPGPFFHLATLRTIATSTTFGASIAAAATGYCATGPYDSWPIPPAPR